MRLLVMVIAWLLIMELAKAGERVACSAEPGGKDWHYRTRIPGFGPGVRDDRCWYQGAAMKPREELYWSLVPPTPEPVVITDPAQMRPPWQLEPRWRGAKEGWDHKE